MFDSIVRFEVEPSKIRNYLLDPSHPRGGSKARFLASHGFDRTRPTELADALRGHAAAHTATRKPNAFGQRFLFEGPLTTPDGRHPQMRTVWQIEAGSDVARLVTAYPIR